MRWMLRCLALVLAFATFTGPLAAQTKSTPDDLYEQAMSHWRAAMWYSRLGDSNVTGIEIDTLQSTWQTVADMLPDVRPSLYAKDPTWPQTVAEITKLVGAASDAVDRNDLKAAAAALEKVGDDLAAARQAAGTSGFSDAVRRYRVTIDRLSGLVSFAEQRQGTSFDDRRRAEVASATTACAAAAAVLTPAIPSRWIDDEKLKTLIRQNLDSVKALQDELARRASGLEIAATINVLRSNYALLFLNYG